MNILNNSGNSTQVRAILEQLSKCILIYHPLNKDETMRIFLYSTINYPQDKVSSKYEITGKDITHLFDNNTIAFNSADTARRMMNEAEKIDTFRYCFSGDYSFETIEKKN